MTKSEREADPGSSFDGGYHLYAEEKHKERVSKTPARIEYAKKMFICNGIQFDLKNPQTGHFHVKRKSDGKLFQFWAGTGKILGYDKIRGIYSLIKIITK